MVGCGQGGDLDEVVGQDPLSGPDPGSVDAVEDAVVPAVLVGAENPVTSRISEDVGEPRSGGSDPSCD